VPDDLTGFTFSENGIPSLLENWVEVRVFPLESNVVAVTVIGPPTDAMMLRHSSRISNFSPVMESDPDKL